MRCDMKISLIMLAAGNSRRFGSNKLLYEIGGEPMYRHILTQLECVCRELTRRGIRSHITVVTQYEAIAATARTAGAGVYYNVHPDEGISSSVKIGLLANETSDACLFTVADQPWLTADTILSLVDTFLKEKKGIACVSTKGKTGNPCIFSRKYYPELMKLTGDVGGKQVIMAHRQDTAIFPVLDGRELTDLDRPVQAK